MRVQSSKQTYIENSLAMLRLMVITNSSIIWAEPDMTVQPTRDEYMGQSWCIDAHHLLWWQGKPYIRYGFTGNGDVDRFMNKGHLSTFVAGTKMRFPLETVTTLLDSIQKECGSAKTYFANEFGHPQRGGDDFVDDFGLGSTFSLTSKEDLRNFLPTLVENWCKGFNTFKMNPNVPTSQKEVEWFSQLKPEIVQKIIETKEYREVVRITADEAVLIARKHPSLSTWLEKHPKAKETAAFNEHYCVWIVEFIEDDREIGFASVSMDGRILESETR